MITLKEILKNEERNKGRIYLYQEEGGMWYAYEQSAFYCYSLLGVLDIYWCTALIGQDEQVVVKARISEPDRFLTTPLLRLSEKRSTEYVITFRITCGGFRYWRDEQKQKFQSFSRKAEAIQEENKKDWQGVFFKQHNKTGNMSYIQQPNIPPVIDEIYDPLTQRRDGTITPCAPVLITGKNFLFWPEEKIKFCLCSLGEPERLYPVLALHKYTEDRILVTLPNLENGEYQPVLQLEEDTGGKQKYYFPVTWKVKHMSLMETYENRRKVNYINR